MAFAEGSRPFPLIDAHDCREALTLMLAARGRAVRRAANGRGGLRFASEEPPDAIPLGLHLPAAHGAEAARAGSGITPLGRDRLP
ncbi:MAG TPA: hypothetical protein PLE19_16610 [Planctomycetota bacterium]|nr:hypothetical protein [Planctomycetota bacterium]HRR82482.1 hypothetical protein [Planctomycetota bacterium]HRT94296.1 hypothetical protein [Planctomycetota bacterium]